MVQRMEKSHKLDFVIFTANPSFLSPSSFAVFFSILWIQEGKKEKQERKKERKNREKEVTDKHYHSNHGSLIEMTT